MEVILLANLASTLMMTGVIWIVQIVHYPLFDRVGTQGFARYEADHATRITSIVLPLMTVELLTALALALEPPPGIPASIFWVGLALAGVAWLSTAFIQLPLHAQLSSGFDVAAYRNLVNTNWIRTITWSLRSILVIGVIAHYVHIAS